MTLPCRLTALTLAGSLLTPVTPGAQTVGSATGSIAGNITDQTGAVVVDAVVTAISTALMGVRTTASGPDGGYRVAGLPPGNYVLAFDAPGMRPAERHVRVTLGFVASLDVILEVEGVIADVTVAAEPRVLDRHSSTAFQSFDTEQLGSLPGSRSMLSLLGATSAVEVARFEVGGGPGVPGGAYGAYGVRGWNRPMLEGISVSGIFPSGFTLDYGSFEEAAVITAAQGPEWPSAGVHTQFVTKSGGNTYRGTLYLDYEHRDWQSFNIDRDQVMPEVTDGGLASREVNRVWDYHDLNADAGGFVVRDAVWWYASVRRQETSTRLVNFPARPYTTRLHNFGGKGTYRVTDANRVIVFAQAGRNHQPNRLDPFSRSAPRLGPLTAINESEDSTANQLARGVVWKTEWNSVIGDNLLVEARVGRFSADQRWTPHSSARRSEDTEELDVAGGNRDWERRLHLDQIFANGSYFADGFAGSHHLRVGAEAIRTLESEAWFEGYPGNVLQVLHNRTPAAVFRFETPSRSEHGLWTYAAHASDSWRLRDRLTLNLGIRFDRNRVFLPAQEHPPTGRRFAAQQSVIVRNRVAPRIGTAFDVTGDGTSLIKLTVGLYQLPILIGGIVNPNPAEWWKKYQWSDPDGSGRWEPGEQGEELARRGETATTSVDPGLKSPAITEATAWFERQLPAGVAVKAGAVWRRASRQWLRQDTNRPFAAFTIPVLVTDPGLDGETGTTDDGGTLVAYDLPPERRDEPAADIIRNVPATSEHWTLEASATRRTRGRWSLSAGVSHTWHRDHSDAYAGQSVRNNLFPLTPNDLINAGPGGRFEFTTWTAKASGTYEALWGVSLTPHLRHQSGQPFGRTFVTTLSYGSVRLLAEPIGTRRMDNTTIVDIRIEKNWRLGHRRLAGFIDVFNCFNANAEQNAVWSSGSSFLRPLAIVPPRIARVGAKVDW